jgi:hypothetical protein
MNRWTTQQKARYVSRHFSRRKNGGIAFTSALPQPGDGFDDQRAKGN